MEKKTLKTDGMNNSNELTMDGTKEELEQKLNNGKPFDITKLHSLIDLAIEDAKRAESQIRGLVSMIQDEFEVDQLEAKLSMMEFWINDLKNCTKNHQRFVTWLKAIEPSTIKLTLMRRDGISEVEANVIIKMAAIELLDRINNPLNKKNPNDVCFEYLKLEDDYVFELMELGRKYKK